MDIGKKIKNLFHDFKLFFSPRVTYIVATKMHGTRFASSNRSLQLGKGLNLPAGTVVDTEITSFDKFDFYLQSSMGIQVDKIENNYADVIFFQGTSIPTHYYILHDDNRLDADSAQVIQFSLSHIFILSILGTLLLSLSRFRSLQSHDFNAKRDEICSARFRSCSKLVQGHSSC